MSASTILRRYMAPALANAIIEDTADGDATIHRFLPRLVADEIVTGPATYVQIYKYLPRVVADAIVEIAA